jgi:hypothetical protein
MLRVEAPVTGVVTRPGKREDIVTIESQLRHRPGEVSAPSQQLRYIDHMPAMTVVLRQGRPVEVDIVEEGKPPIVKAGSQPPELV